MGMVFPKPKASHSHGDHEKHKTLSLFSSASQHTAARGHHRQLQAGRNISGSRESPGGETLGKANEPQDTMRNRLLLFPLHLPDPSGFVHPQCHGKHHCMHGAKQPDGVSRSACLQQLMHNGRGRNEESNGGDVVQRKREDAGVCLMEPDRGGISLGYPLN